MFYGWGKSSQEWNLNDGNRLVFAYSYFSLMFLFKIAYKKKWFVTGDSRSQDAQFSRDELEQRYGADLPKPGIWTQYGLPLAIGAWVLVALVLSVF